MASLFSAGPLPLIADSRSCLEVHTPNLLKLTTFTEGTWDEVMRLIGQAHTLVHQNGVVRVQTDIRAGTRYSPLPFLYPKTNVNSTDKKQHFTEKVSKVESILAGDVKSVEKKVVTTQTVPGAQAKGAEPGAAKEGPAPPTGVAANKGTWASMLKK